MRGRRPNVGLRVSALASEHHFSRMSPATRGSRGHREPRPGDVEDRGLGGDALPERGRPRSRQAVRQAREVLDEERLQGEVVVVDNGSTDRTAELAEAAGARVIAEPERGYGNAYRAGFAAARGDYILMLDADLTYPIERPAQVHRRARRRRRPGDGRPLRGARARGDAVAAPLRRQPGPHRHPQPLLPHRRQGRPLRDAGAAPRRPPPARPAQLGDGVRLRDGDPGGEERPRRSRSSRSSTTRARASRSSRPGATAGGTCASCSSTAPPTSSSSPARSSARSRP